MDLGDRTSELDVIYECVIEVTNGTIKGTMSPAGQERWTCNDDGNWSFTIPNECTYS